MRNLNHIFSAARMLVSALTVAKAQGWVSDETAMRLLQLRQKFAQPEPSPEEQALLDAIFPAR